MPKKFTTWPGSAVAAHIIETLPDSFSKRRALLESLLAIMPDKHPLRRTVVEMVHALILQNLHQRNLPGLFIESEASK